MHVLDLQLVMEAKPLKADGIGYNNSKKGVKRKRCKQRVNRRFSPFLQSLFEICEEMFKERGSVPLPSDVERTCHLLDNMKAEDVGLSGDLPFFKCYGEDEDPARVTSSTIYTCDRFTLCIFIIPWKARIPLHDHPGMTVFSKLLLGKMQIKSHDFVNPLNIDKITEAPPDVKLAKVITEGELSAPCKACVLYPSKGGNIHELTAITPCLILDVIGPPYSKEEGRDSSYYLDFPYQTWPCEVPKDGFHYRWLQEIDKPEDSEMDIIPYLGPKPVPTVLRKLNSYFKSMSTIL